jgi:hypothetical protein
VSNLTTAQKLVILFVAWMVLSGGSIGAPGKATAATYVHEKDATAIPSAVMAALDKLNRRGIVATVFEADTTDGTGETPEQYKVPLAAAKESGLPSLVVMGGATVLKVLKAPITEGEVLEAAP